MCVSPFGLKRKFFGYSFGCFGELNLTYNANVSESAHIWKGETISFPPSHFGDFLRFDYINFVCVCVCGIEVREMC